VHACEFTYRQELSDVRCMFALSFLSTEVPAGSPRAVA
jgi:hypothetical protein